MTYNQSGYIVDAMNGICMQQTNFAYVGIIMDDASTDGEQEVILKYLEDHFDIDATEYVNKEETDDYTMLFARHKENTNCYFAVFFLKYNHYSDRKMRDRKMSYLSKWETNVKYIAFCEGDDYWTDSHKLKRQVDFLDSNIEFVICSHTYIRAEEQTNTRFFDFNDYSFNYYKDYCIYRITLDNFLEKWALQPLSCLVRAECMPLNYPKRFKIIYDIILFYYVLKKGDGAMLYNNMGVYRVHLSSVWQGSNQLDRYKLRYDEVVNLFQIEHNKFLLKDLSKTINGILLYYLKRGDVKNCCKNIHQFMIDLPIGFVFYCILNVSCHLFISFFRKIRYIF